MAEREDPDENNGEVNERLKVFCESFVKNFEKILNEIEEEAALGGTSEIGKKNCFKLESFIGSTNFVENQRENSIFIYDELRQIKNDKDFRKILVSAAGEIFWCFQNQFILVTDNRNMVLMGIETLAFDGVSRLFNYISSTKNRKIDIKTFCDFITEGTILGKSKTGHMIKYQNNSYKTSQLFEDVGILEINEDESKKYHNRKGSSCTFSYRFSFSWENFKDFLVKTYTSGEEPIINCDLTKNVLYQQLENILRIINSEDNVWNIKETTKNTTTILEKVNNNTLMMTSVATNLNNLKPAIENIHTNTIQENANMVELKTILENIYETTTHIAADVKNIHKNGATKNDQHKMNHVWFDMRKPVITFTGRIEILQKLYETLHHATESTVISQNTSVSGLGGIGKSELARKYAFKYEDAYDGNLIWINSETNESLKDSFGRLAEQLNIPVNEKKIESIILNIYNEFGKGKCLFIFDNAEEYEIIKDFLPLCLPSNIQTPHILVTSRNQKWQLADTGAMNVISLDYFTSDESLEFIKNALEIKNNSTDDEIKNLAKELDNFPLALGQAVAYIEMKDERTKKFRGGKFGVSDYLKAYKDESLKPKLLEHRHVNSQYNKTVLTTWNITLKNIEEEDEDSIKIIEIMAYLVPDSINPDLIFSELIEDEENREDAIDLLLKYSMINIKDRILSIHRLVQEVIRHQLKVNGKEKDVLKNALKLLGFNPRYGDIHLISVWSYACDYGEIIDEFFIKYKRYGCLMTPFNLIVENGNIDAVKKILNHFQKNSNEKFQDILNSTKYHHMTPLEISIRHNNLEMAKVLIGFGAEKDIKICVKSIFDGSVELVNYFYPNNVEYLLHAKFYSAFKSESVESLNNLLKDLTNEQIKNILEQKITNVDPKLIIESPPLILAVQKGNLDIVKLFINYGVDVNVSCADGTPLHASVRNNHYEIMKCLIENGANCNTVNSCENTVLHTAAKRGHLELITYLINNNKCDRNDINKWGWTALDVATEYNRLEVVEFLRK